MEAAVRGASAAAVEVGGEVEGAVDVGRAVEEVEGAGAEVEAAGGEVGAAEGSRGRSWGLEVARGVVEAARGVVEAARGVVISGLRSGASWVRGEEREDWGRLGESEKAASVCSSRGRSTANLCTPILMVFGSFPWYWRPFSATWRGLKATVQVRTTPCASGEVLTTLHNL